MKLLIEIPAEQYETLNAKSQSEVKAIINTPGLVKAIKDGKPFADVLNGLSDDIRSMDFDFGDFYDHTEQIREMILAVIDKYRKENLHERRN